MIRTRIIGTGRYLPEKIMTNHDLSEIMDTSDEWIRQRTGILQRHIAAENEGPSDMGAVAVRRALDAAGLSPKDVDYLICATITPDYLFPASACVMQHLLGMKNAGAMDINAACSGFLYGLQVADAFIRGGTHRTVVVVGAEVLTRRINWNDRNTAVLFGDGAGAVVVQADFKGRGVLSTYTNADGSDADILSIPMGGTKNVVTPDNVHEMKLSMDGRALYRRAVHAFGDATEKALEPTGIRAEDITWFVPHQANMRIIEAVAHRLKMPEDRIFTNLERVANTSAASIPIALDEMVELNKLQDGDLLLMAAFGAGLTWAGSVVRW